MIVYENSIKAILIETVKNNSHQSNSMGATLNHSEIVHDLISLWNTLH